MEEVKKKIHFTKFWKPNIQDDILLFKGHFNTFEFDKHAHEEYTLTLVHDGNMTAYLDGSSQKFTKSTILTINPDKIHACKTYDEEGYNYTSLYFNEDVLKQLAKDEFGKNRLYFDKTTLFNQTIYNKLAYLIASEEQGLISKLEFEVGLIEALKSTFMLNTNRISLKNISSHDKLVSKAKEFINDNFFVNLSLDDIANEMNISKYHFLRLFKQKTHFSPHEYLMNRRLEKAKQSLQKGESIINSAYSCGFNDQSHLHRRFKATMGMTPKNYQDFFI